VSNNVRNIYHWALILELPIMALTFAQPNEFTVYYGHGAGGSDILKPKERL